MKKGENISLAFGLFDAAEGGWVVLTVLACKGDCIKPKCKDEIE